MRFKSIRFKLTAWYLLGMLATLVIFAVGARYAMEESVERAVDQELEIRLRDVEHFLESTTNLDHAELIDELGEQARRISLLVGLTAVPPASRRTSTRAPFGTWETT